MRSRSSRNDAAAMDLFPFMAVLICTVGALIMLLVVMVQQARVKAREPEVAAEQREEQREEQLQKQQQALEELHRERQATLDAYAKRKAAAEKKKFQADELKWKADLLRSSYEEAVGQVADQRLALSHLESHTRELSEQASAMQAEADLIAKTAQQAATTDDQTEDTLQALDAAIASAKSELKATQTELENVDPKYVLIPYAGPNGTDRRPIYIECLPDRVVLQPENVLLIGEDFLAPLTAENPLARALRAKREFLQDNGLIGADAEPYPLLVVRPGAAASYAAARSAMTSWESEFGYELVEADVDLDYMDADPRLTQLLEDVVLETRGRRRMMRTVRARVRPRRKERLRPSASGGFETVSVGEPGFDATGSGSYDDQLPFTTDMSQAGSGNARGSATAGSAASTGGSSERGGMSSSGFASAGDHQPQSMQDGFAPGAGRSSNRWADSAAARARQGASAGSGDGWGSGNGESQFSGSGTGPGSGSGERSTADSEQGRLAFDATAGDSPRAQAPDGAFGDASRGGGPGGSAGRPGAGGVSAEATGSGGRGATGSGGSGSVASAQEATGASGMQMGASSSSLAASRGSGWAMNHLQPDAVGIQRPMYVVCAADVISLLPEKGTRQTNQSWQHRGSADRVVDAFVKAVQERFESWGIAGQGIYWKPVLKVRVEEDADAIFLQLRHLLNDSGIEVTRQP